MNGENMWTKANMDCRDDIFVGKYDILFHTQYTYLSNKVIHRNVIGGNSDDIVHYMP